MVAIEWSDGSTTTADTWEQLTEAVAAKQMWPWQPEEFFGVMAKRVYRWGGVSVDLDATHRQLWQAAAEAKLVLITKDDEEVAS